MMSCLRPACYSIVSLALLSSLACGGSSGKAEGAGATNDSATQDSGSGDGDYSAEATGPDCSDGTCFQCGDGICPTGAHCDEDAQGGAACAWLPECSGKPTCACVTKVLGSSCACDESSGGPSVSCQ